MSADLVEQAVTGRRSVRAFLPTPVPQPLVQRILDGASSAPSGSNTQPWKVYVLQGQALAALVRKVTDVVDAAQADPAVAAQYQEEFAYYPRQWTEPYLGRRRENGWGLYTLLGIGRGETPRMWAQQRRTFPFFDAPVGLVFTMDRVLERGSLIDNGMFLQNIKLLARAHGLDTCPQAAWNHYGSIVQPQVGAADAEMLVCGMALGYADESAVVNQLRTSRVPTEQFTTWLE